MTYETNIDKHLKKMSEKNKIVNIQEYDFKGDVTKIVKNLENLNINNYHMQLNIDEFEKWFNKIDYMHNFPNYVKAFKYSDSFNTHCGLLKKAYEHYISAKLLDIKENDIYLDVASSHSPFPDIVKNEHSQHVYRQDLNYPEGVNGDKIGSNASNIPLKDNFIDKIGLHCSFEHFENSADYEFINEAYRILKKEGKFCITPLYLAEEHYVVTSPSIWESKYKNANELPVFEEDATIVIWDKIKQRQEKFFSPQELFNKIINKFSHMFAFQVVIIDNYLDFNGTMRYMDENEEKNKIFYPYILMGTKK